MKLFRSLPLRLVAVLLMLLFLSAASFCYVSSNDRAGMGEIFTYTDYRNTDAYGSRLQKASKVMEELVREVYEGSKVTPLDLDGTEVSGAFHYYFYADGVCFTDIPFLENVDFSHAKALAVYRLGNCYLMDTTHTQSEQYSGHGDYSWKPYDLTRTVSLSVFECDAGVILVPDEKWINEEYETWDAAKNQALLFILFSFLSLVPMAFLTMSVFFKGPSSGAKTGFRLFTELYVVGILSSFFMFLQILDLSYLEWLRGFFTLFGRGDDRTVYAAFMALFAGLISLLFLSVLGLVRAGRESRILKGSFLRWFCLRPYLALKSRLNRAYVRKYRYSTLFALRTALFVAAELALLIFFVVTAVNRYWVVLQILLLFGAVFVAVLYFFSNFRDLRSLNRILEHITALQEGKLTFRADIPEGDAFSGYEEQLRAVGDGFEQTLRNQVSAERSRVNLVTNVSHDLRTPLTSIIGYLDLLSKLELSPEAQDCVRVLTKKSNRLNQLVSDVFALSKATSGAESVPVENLDLFLLARQMVADLSDTATAAGKTVRLVGEGNAPVCSNGNKLYRILQNMLDNALKYSLEGTRVFVTLAIKEGRACVTVKNTSSYEMNFSAEEITEQFVRGDPSRTGDGSGLGLAIAKSFTEQLGGKFFIEIDGDQFSSTISFPLRNQENSTESQQEDK